jgi:hypothetical protein
MRLPIAHWWTESATLAGAFIDAIEKPIVKYLSGKESKIDETKQPIRAYLRKKGEEHWQDRASAQGVFSLGDIDEPTVAPQLVHEHFLRTALLSTSCTPVTAPNTLKHAFVRSSVPDKADELTTGQKLLSLSFVILLSSNTWSPSGVWQHHDDLPSVFFFFALSATFPSDWLLERLLIKVHARVCSFQFLEQLIFNGTLALRRRKI